MASYSDLIKKAKKDWNCSSLMDGASAELGEKIPFTSPLVNWATYGGIPRNRITEFSGENGSGKSTTAVDVCKNAIVLFQKEYDTKVTALRERISDGDKSAYSELEDLEELGPKKVLYIDLEHGFDGAWAKTLGIEPEDMDLMQPPDVSAEEILQMVQEIISTGEIGLIVLDSVPSLVTQKELDKKYGESTVAPLAGLMTTFCRKVVSLLTRYGCTMLLINQIRDNLNNPYVVNTPGGKALKFYSSLRISFRLGKPVDFLGNDLPMNTESPAGYLVDIRLIKQKTAPFDRKSATYYLMCQNGIAPDFDYVKLAIDSYHVIRKSGAWFSICDPNTGEVLEDADGKPVKVHGLAKVYDFLNSNLEYYESLKKFIINDISGKSEVGGGSGGSEESN